MNLLRVLGSKSKEEREIKKMRTLKEIGGQTQKEREEKSRQLVEMLAKKEGLDFNELWDMFELREGGRDYGDVNKVVFSIPKHAPIEYWYDMKKHVGDGWRVYTAIPRYLVTAHNLGDALVIAKEAYKRQPWEFERVVAE